VTDTTNPLGVSEHSHGGDIHVPASKRDDRTRSFTPADFPVPNGREEEWRFSPVRKLSDFFADPNGPAGRAADGRPIGLDPAAFD